MKIRPLYEMYNTDLHLCFMPGVIADVPEELAQEYIAACTAEPVEEKARAEPTPEKPKSRTKKTT